MRADYIAVKQSHLSTMFHQQNRQNIGDRGFTGSAETGEPNAKASLMSRRSKLGKNSRDFGPREPIRKSVPFSEIIGSNLSTRNRSSDGSGCDFVRFLIASFGREVNQLLERYHLNADLLLILA